MAITNGTFDSNILGWTSTHDSSSYYNTSYATYWDNGKAHVRSGSRYGGGFEAFAYFYQRFLVDKPILVFDIQALISGDGLYACADDSTCGWTLKNDSGTIIGHGKPGTTLTTVSIDVTSYIGVYLTITFAAGAARDYNEYYDLLVDNVMTVIGMKFNPICGDTGQYCTAYLYIDNNFMGTTPYTTMLSAGTHNYSLFKSGYNRFDDTLNITSTDITNAQSTGISFEPTISAGPGGILNPTFDTDLLGWTIIGSVIFDNGRVRIDDGGTIYQIFVVADNILEFDWETVGWSPSDSGLGYKIYIDEVLKIDKRLPGNYGNPLSGTENVYLGNYIGRTVKVLFYEAYGWHGWIDNIRFAHTTGIYNGNFDQGLDGWDTFGNVGVEDWFGPAYTNTNGAVHPGGRLEQTFVIGQCVLKFDWLTSDPTNGYDLYVDGLQIISKTLPEYSSGTETIDVSTYIGQTAKISFWCNGYILAVDNVATSVDAYGISVISYPPGADIYLDDNPTGQITGDTPVIVYTGSEGNHTITLKLIEYPDYVETVNVVRCITSYVSGVFGGCVTFLTNPPGAKICIDDVDTGEITPKTLCGYSIGSSHTYSLYLKNYRVETETITFTSDQGVLVDKTLIYETGSTLFNVTPSGSKIILDGIDTGKVTPDIVDNISIGYHNYDIQLQGYYSLTGSFRSIVDTVKQITGTLQQITGVVNGKFDSDLIGWTPTTPDPNIGNVEWQDGRAHLYGHDISSGLTIYQDITVTEDSLIFDYNVADIRYSCDAGWYIIIDPDTPDAITVASWCSGSGGYQGGRFEADVSTHIGKTARILFYLNCRRRFSWNSDAWVDNVGNVPKPIRSVTFDAFCSVLQECPTNSLQMTKCYADLYFDGNYIGIDQITLDNISIGNHTYLVTNQGYTSIDSNLQNVTGNISFAQGVSTNSYIDNIFLPTITVPAEGCIYFESIPPGLSIYVDGINTGKITPDTICNLNLGNHTYELKLLHSSYQGNFILGSQFGEYIHVELYGKIQFDTIPEGASITLDDIDLGIQTPYTTGNLPIGMHTYVIRLNNFQEQICQIEVIRDQISIVNLELASLEGCLYVDSCPSGTAITFDGTIQGTTPISICNLTNHHEYTLNRIGYFDYTEAIDIPLGIGANRKIQLVRKIGAPFLDPTKEICSSNSSRIVFSAPPPYYPDTEYNGKDAFQMPDGGVELIDAQGYDVIHLHVLYHNFWVGYTDGPIGGRINIYQSDTPGDCTTRPADAELILSQVAESYNGTLYNSIVLFDDSLNISKRYIRIETSEYACSLFNCWGDGSSSIFVMEKIPAQCPVPPTTTCEIIPAITSIEVSPPTTNVIIGDTQQFTAICKDQNDNLINCATITWDVVDHTIGSISDTGLFTGISEGTTSITATSGNITGNAQAAVIVAPPPPPVEAGFGNAGMLLTAGLFFGLLVHKRCQDNDTKEKCEKNENDCQWKKNKCTPFTKEQKFLIDTLRNQGATGVPHCKNGECRIGKWKAIYREGKEPIITDHTKNPPIE